MFLTSSKNLSKGSTVSRITSNKLKSLYIFEVDVVGEVVVGFTPLDLFQSGEQGVWYDPSDLSTLFQDAAGTTPVTSDGDPVGLMQDKSGNGNDATQVTSAARPAYRTDGTLHWLEFDDVDDHLDMPVLNVADFDMTLGYTRNGSGAEMFIYGGQGGASFLGVVESGSSSSPDNNSGGPVYRVDNSTVTPNTRAQLHTDLPDGVSVVFEVDGFNSTTWDEFRFGQYSGANLELSGKAFNIVFVEGLGSGDADLLREYIAEKSGVTL
jgi:hypothetical protein